MSVRTYNKYSDELTSLFYDDNTGYVDFVEKGRVILEKACKHRDITKAEYMALLDSYEDMCSSLAFAFPEDCE